MATLTVEMKDKVFEDFKKQCVTGASPELVAQHILANYTYGMEVVFSADELAIMAEAIRTAGWVILKEHNEESLEEDTIINLTVLGMLVDKCNVYALAVKGRENESKQPVQ